MNNHRAQCGIADPLLRTNPVWCLDRLVAAWKAELLRSLRALLERVPYF
jgi:hypothetical protein